MAFTAAALLVTFGFGLALALGLGDLILSLVPKPGRTVKYALIAFALDAPLTGSLSQSVAGAESLSEQPLRKQLVFVG